MLRTDSRFARQATQALGDSPFRLVDAGVTGGLGRGWAAFGDTLRVLGLCADDAQVQALAAANPSARMRFVRQPANLRSPFKFDSWPRRFSVDRTRALAAGDRRDIERWTRAALAERLQPADAADLAEGAHGLVDLLETEGFASADFLRVEAGDIDGAILRGVEPLLDGGAFIGVGLRLRLYGTRLEQGNALHEMDRLLRSHGFDLVALSPILFSAAALPAPYMDSHPDHTLSGRPMLASGVYMRDLARTPSADPARLIKAAALYGLLNLPDMAAELIIAHRPVLEAFGLDVDAGLDLLALQTQEDFGTTTRYRDYVAAFERNEARFYDVYSGRALWMQGLMTAAREAPVEIDRLSALVRQKSRKLYADAPRVAPTADALRADALRRSDLSPSDHWIFDHFDGYRGAGDPSVYIDWIGDRIRPQFEAWGPVPSGPLWAPPIPAVDEEYFEWMDIAQAALEAGPTFTMLELGAGYGRWSSRGALLARQLGKSVRLGLAEAEPKHQQWLREHLADNGIPPAAYDAFDFAVSGEAGQVVFTVGKPGGSVDDTDYGQAVMPFDLAGQAPVGDYFGQPMFESRDGWRCIVVDQKPLSAIVGRYDVIDIIDFDLQGAEALAIAEALPLLTARVRRLHIGTHGHDIEADLRAQLSAAGWICLRDFPCHGAHDTPFGPVVFVDGVQSWVNPARLGGA